MHLTHGSLTMANIFVTFDYELFFGVQTGTAENCLLDPTNRLIQMAEKYQARFTFFVDVLYLMKLKEYSTGRIKPDDAFEYADSG